MPPFLSDRDFERIHCLNHFCILNKGRTRATKSPTLIDATELTYAARTYKVGSEKALSEPAEGGPDIDSCAQTDSSERPQYYTAGGIFRLGLELVPERELSLSANRAEKPERVVLAPCGRTWVLTCRES
jgi:hypothetical protein